MEWKKVQKQVLQEHKTQGYAGRFGAGLPRVSDGSLLFLLHLISKMSPIEEGGSRIGIILNGSPLFTGGAGSGESEIRRFVLESDLLESLQSDKAFIKLGSLGDEILTSLAKMDNQIDDRAEFIKALDIKLTASLIQKHIGEHNEEAELCYDKKGKLEPNAELRDYENVPLSEDIYKYFKREVKPHVPLAWIDEKKRDAKDGKVGIVGYEIPFNRHFYEYVPPRSLEEIDKELEVLSQEIVGLLNEI